jgi:hypothetical protein
LASANKGIAAMPGGRNTILLHIVWFTFVFQSAAVLHSSNTYR